MKIAIIGAGNMGGAIARGIAAKSLAQVRVSNPSEGKLSALSSEFPQIYTTHSNSDAVKGADLILLAVKPWKVAEVVADIKPAIDCEHQVIASVVAGISTEELAAMFETAGKRPGVYYIIPNTAISKFASMTFIAPRGTKSETDSLVLSIFNALGNAMILEERLMPAATALSSCGIAYVLRYIRAMEEGGVQLGFYPGVAQSIVLQTILGAVSLLHDGKSHPEAEIDKVTTPGGMTIKGLNAMEAAGFTNAVIQGILAPVKK